MPPQKVHPLQRECLLTLEEAAEDFGSASVAVQSRFCRSLKTLKRGVDFSEMIANMSLSILEYSKFPACVQGKLRKNYLRTHMSKQLTFMFCFMLCVIFPCCNRKNDLTDSNHVCCAFPHKFPLELFLGEDWIHEIEKALAEEATRAMSEIDKCTEECGLTFLERSLLIHILLKEQDCFSNVRESFYSLDCVDVGFIDVKFIVHPSDDLLTYNFSSEVISGVVHMNVTKYYLPEIDNQTQFHVAIVSSHGFCRSKKNEVKTSVFTVDFDKVSLPKD